MRVLLLVITLIWGLPVIALYGLYFGAVFVESVYDALTGALTLKVVAMIWLSGGGVGSFACIIYLLVDEIRRPVIWPRQPGRGQPLTELNTSRTSGVGYVNCIDGNAGRRRGVKL